MAATIEAAYSKTVEEAKADAAKNGTDVTIPKVTVPSYIPFFGGKSIDSSTAHVPAMIAGKAAPWLAPTPKQITKTANAMAPVIADTVAKTVTDPNYRTADGKSLSALADNDAAFADAIKSEIRKALVDNEEKLRLTAPLNGKTGKKNKNGTEQTNLDVWTDSIGDELAKPGNIKQLKPVALEINRQTLQQAAANFNNGHLDIKHTTKGNEIPGNQGAAPITPGSDATQVATR